MTKKKPTQKKKQIVKMKDPKDSIQEVILSVVKEGSKQCKTGKGEIDRTALYLIGLLHGKTKKKSAMDAGFAYATSRNPSVNIEQTEQFKSLKENMTQELVKKGITIETMAGTLSEMMNKRDSTFVWGKEIKGEQIDSVSAKMALDTISKLLGLNAPEKKSIVIADLRDVKALTDEELDERLMDIIKNT